MKNCATPGEIPTSEHWAIVDSSSVDVPGDERSLSAPGHGYPAHTVKYLEYQAFPSLQSLQDEVTRREKSKYSSQKEYVVIHVIPLKITTEVKVAVG